MKAQKAKNPDHSNEINRLNRIIGQMDGIKKMVQEARYCPEILTQTRAVASAIRSFEATILEKHLKHCVHEAFHSSNKAEINRKVSELVELFQKRMPS